MAGKPKQTLLILSQVIHKSNDSKVRISQYRKNAMQMNEIHTLVSKNNNSNKIMEEWGGGSILLKVRETVLDDQLTMTITVWHCSKSLVKGCLKQFSCFCSIQTFLKQTGSCLRGMDTLAVKGTLCQKCFCPPLSMRSTQEGKNLLLKSRFLPYREDSIFQRVWCIEKLRKSHKCFFFPFEKRWQKICSVSNVPWMGMDLFAERDNLVRNVMGPACQ